MGRAKSEDRTDRHGSDGHVAAADAFIAVTLGAVLAKHGGCPAGGVGGFSNSSVRRHRARVSPFSDRRLKGRIMRRERRDFTSWRRRCDSLNTAIGT